MLNLSRNALGVSGMRKLQRFIVKASFLTHLDMSGCELGCDGVSVLSEYFMCLPLVYLNLARNQVADKGTSPLVYLNLARNQVADKGTPPPPSSPMPLSTCLLLRYG